MFIYGVNSRRQISDQNALNFLTDGNVWLLIIVLSLNAAALYSIRRQAKLQRVSFVLGLLELFAIVFGGGNIRCRHSWEKRYFAIAMIGSFFLISLYLAYFSMHSMMHSKYQKIDTFEKLAKHNITYYLVSNLAENEVEVTQMLR